MAIDTPARIAVIGAGPIGLEAALYARYLGYEVDVFERGEVGDYIRRWGHVRMFTPFGMNGSPLGRAALKAQDNNWQPPADDEILSGSEYLERYLLPLAASDLLADSIHRHSEVVSVARDGLLKQDAPADPPRDDSDLRLLVRGTAEGDHGRERFVLADAVIDTSGNYGHPNWLGPGGLPAVGETAARRHVEYGLPDVLGAEHQRYAGRNILLIGAGDSAATNLTALVKLAGQAPDTWITWITREVSDEQHPQPIACAADEPLAQRARLAQAANQLAASDANHVTFSSGTWVESIEWHGDLDRFHVHLAGQHAAEADFDRVIANVGYRGDWTLANELQLVPHPITGGYDLPAFDEAGRETPGHADRELDFYVLGAKSRGRSSRFLIADGLAQIRHLFTIIGDRPNLDLYATMKGLY